MKTVLTKHARFFIFGFVYNTIGTLSYDANNFIFIHFSKIKLLFSFLKNYFS